MASIQVRQLAEFSVPALSIGVAAGLVASGLAAFAGQPTGWAVITGLALGIPIAFFATGYAVLVALGKVPAGVFAPAAMYWLVGFPVALMAHAVVTEWVFLGSPGLPEAPLEFLAFRALLSMGFAIGFLWMHEQLGRHWWPRIRAHNEYAYRCVEQYKELATTLAERKAATGRDRARKRRTAA
ncbi:hypothetical protein [Kribbella deserti]|uniref:ATP-binding protein n=1 Tax=Kribbella deserti TaxID=1926257 RepID=A0ABV6QEP2_9ACTN